MSFGGSEVATLAEQAGISGASIASDHAGSTSVASTSVASSTVGSSRITSGSVASDISVATSSAKVIVKTVKSSTKPKQQKVSDMFQATHDSRGFSITGTGYADEVSGEIGKGKKRARDDGQ